MSALAAPPPALLPSPSRGVLPSPALGGRRKERRRGGRHERGTGWTLGAAGRTRRSLAFWPVRGCVMHFDQASRHDSALGGRRSQASRGAALSRRALVSMVSPSSAMGAHFQPAWLARVSPPWVSRACLPPPPPQPGLKRQPGSKREGGRAHAAHEQAHSMGFRTQESCAKCGRAAPCPPAGGSVSLGSLPRAVGLVAWPAMERASRRPLPAIALAWDRSR